ncbi:MAG: hypothetical protein ACRC0R_02465 [Cetobacterium sp.]
MRCDLAIEFTKTFAEIQQNIEGKTDILIDMDKSKALIGLMLNGNKYNEDFVFSKLNKIKKRLKISEFNHLIISDKIILIQVEV